MKKTIPEEVNKIGIITVVRSDKLGLEATGRSILEKFKHNKFEWIVWINSSSLDLEDHVRISQKYKAHKIHVEDDMGIFDAMNKSLEKSDADLIIFLNARDTIIEEFDLSSIKGPALIPVQYIDYFGRMRKVKVNRALKFGIPYCHQGMILPRKGYYYDIDFKFGADYLALLNFNLQWPLPILPKGLIQYDTSGVSTVNRWEADKWTARVIRLRFGFVWASLYLCKCLIKLGIKQIYNIKCKLLGK